MVDGFADKAKRLHGLREGSLHHTRENHALGAQCVLVDVGRRNEVVFVSRSVEEFTGMSASSILGKSNLEPLLPTTHWLDDLFNGAPRRHLLDFCHSCTRRTPQWGDDEESELLSVMVLCRSGERPYWSLVHTFLVEQVAGEGSQKGATSHILHILVALEAVVPSTIWITEAGEARIAAKANAEAIKPHLEQVHRDVKVVWRACFCYTHAQIPLRLHAYTSHDILFVRISLFVFARRFRLGGAGSHKRSGTMAAQVLGMHAAFGLNRAKDSGRSPNAAYFGPTLANYLPTLIEILASLAK